MAKTINSNIDNKPDNQEERGYWIFQGNPNIYDVISSIQSGYLKSWSVTAHKDKIKKGDKVILWLTGEKAGCYALCEITSSVYEGQNDDKEMQYYTTQQDNIKTFRVDIKITHNLTNNPILKSRTESDKRLLKLNVGYPGTNFIATKTQYQALLNIAEKSNNRRYWLYSPGEGARLWEEFHEKGIMALGWEAIGDLNQFASKQDIKISIMNVSGKKNPTNDTTVNYEFKSVLSVGDIVFVKKGVSKLLGYGIVSSDYYYDSNRTVYKSCRKVDWKSQGEWDVGHKLVVKTLTNITNYKTEHPDHNKYYERLFGAMGVKMSDIEAGKPEHKEVYQHRDLNIIFYGPPGTGKTFEAVRRASEIIEKREKIMDYDEAMRVFNRELGNRIEFITFHQNYSYEDFVQGLRPNINNGKTLSFERKDGVFMRSAVNALFEYFKILKVSMNNGYAVDDQQLDMSEIYIDFVDYLRKLDDKVFKSKTGREIYLNSFNNKNEPEFRHKESRYKYLVSKQKLLKLYKAYPSIDKVTNVVDDIRQVIGTCDATVYWVALNEFIGYLDEVKKERDSTEKHYEDLTYETKKELLSGIDLNDLKSVLTKNVPNYVLIIDEINRANISRVFGELITLIETDKRSHGSFPMRCKLPSDEELIVPSNLYIIGTMNSADKSIALVDVALRRRFVFEPFYPKYEIDGKSIKYKVVLEKLNEKIIEMERYDFQIGHSYFMDTENMGLLNIMNTKVIPLLLEYFMNKKDEVVKLLIYAGFELKKVQGQITWPLEVVSNSLVQNNDH